MTQISLIQLLRQIQEGLTSETDHREQQQIAFLLLERLANIRKSDLLLDKQVIWSDGKDAQLKDYLDQLNKAIPVQYVLGEAHFWGREFKVNPTVLIPRGETEELVQWIISEHKSHTNGRLLDIGCGSGCIAISLALELPLWSAYACDISPEALQVTKNNALDHHCELDVFEVDILREIPKVDPFDLIVSNPPYIPLHETKTMEEKVVGFEPKEALFVPDDNPLLFYRRIIEISPNLLKPGGWLYFEIHQSQGSAILEIFDTSTWRHFELKKDIHGKDRMIQAQTRLTSFEVSNPG